jgi:DNA-binding response OmpR family regulator
MKILIIEDDRGTAQIVADRLRNDLHTIDIAYDGEEGSFLGRSFAYDCIVLDYILPKKDGAKVLREIRDSGRTTPIIFLSVNDETVSKVFALENGADDYLAKPFSLDELRARINCLTRRPNQIQSHILSVDNLSLNTKNHCVTRAGKRIRLTRKEYSLLEYFMRHVGVVLERTSILEHVWSLDCDPLSNTIETHIMYLRKKICVDEEPNLIANLSGRGYMMDNRENIAHFIKENSNLYSPIKTKNTVNK